MNITCDVYDPIRKMVPTAPTRIQALSHHGQTLIILSDGLGAWSQGDEAAPWALGRMVEKLSVMKSDTKLDIVKIMTEISNSAYEKFCLDKNDPPSFSAAVVLVDTELKLTFFNAGVYEIMLIREGQVTEKSRIPRWVDSYVSNNVISPEEAASHPMKDVGVGPYFAARPDIAVDCVGPWKLQLGDVVILSDRRAFGLIPQQVSSYTGESISHTISEHNLQGVPVIVIKTVN